MSDLVDSTERTAGLCSRCSMRAMDGSQLCRRCYEERARAVYWDREPACSAKGPTKAQCLLVAGHDSAHEGNGFDDYGPVCRSWPNTARAPMPKPSPSGGTET